MLCCLISIVICISLNKENCNTYLIDEKQTSDNFYFKNLQRFDEQLLIDVKPINERIYNSFSKDRQNCYDEQFCINLHPKNEKFKNGQIKNDKKDEIQPIIDQFLKNKRSINNDTKDEKKDELQPLIENLTNDLFSEQYNNNSEPLINYNTNIPTNTSSGYLNTTPNNDLDFSNVVLLYSIIFIIMLGIKMFIIYVISLNTIFFFLSFICEIICFILLIIRSNRN